MESTRACSLYEDIKKLSSNARLKARGEQLVHASPTQRLPACNDRKRSRN